MNLSLVLAFLTRTVAVWGVMLTMAGCTPALMDTYRRDVWESVRSKHEVLVVVGEVLEVVGESREEIALLLLLLVTLLWLRRRRR